MLKFTRRDLLLATAAALALVALLALSDDARAQEDAACETVRFATVGWADIEATTAAASVVLEGLGYETTAPMSSVSIALAGLQNNDVDVFLGNWMPAQESAVEPLIEKGAVERVRANLEGAKFTLAVPRYTAEAGLTDFSDIKDFREQLDGKIYGIESGADGNRHIQAAIEELDMEGFELVPSSEAGMLAQVSRAVRREESIVFLAWAPHPMNADYDLSYLTGGDEWFGPDYGGATVYTLVRPEYLEQCPNVGQFLENLSFTVEMENQIMKAMDQGQSPREAATDWLREHPEVLESWLEGVETRQGEDDALAAVREHLEM